MTKDELLFKKMIETEIKNEKIKEKDDQMLQKRKDQMEVYIYLKSFKENNTVKTGFR